MRALRKWATGRRGCVLVAAMTVATFVVLSVGVVLLFRARFAPRHVETLELIEERTGWVFPPETRIVSAGQDNLGMDFAIWAVLEIPRSEARELFATPPPGREPADDRLTGEFAFDEGEGELPAICRHMHQGYWAFAPDWVPPLPEHFQRYVAAYWFAHRSYDVREVVVEIGDEESPTAAAYVFYTTY
ncbi:MAG: hypothetical protein ACOX9R_16830 [Armatimonadota bacterium]|jgi:hypothetical protein